MAEQAKIEEIRHSLAHILAAVVQEMHPEAKFGVGPVIDNGFYYDIDLDTTLNTDDLKHIEKAMRAMVRSKLDFNREEWPIEDAIKYFKDNCQDFKVELLNDLKSKGSTAVSDAGDSELVDNSVDKVTTVSVYKSVDFVDLCRGPHVANTSEINADAFAITKVSGAYWRGNDKNPQMQRIYGVAFGSKQELDDYQKMLEEAEKRDHRKLGKQLDLFTFSPLVGSGLPLFTPKGTILRELLNDYSQQLRLNIGFEKVWIPHITKKELYETSGHWAKFGEELFLVKSQETSDEMVMKPMNCPHHQQIYASKPRSYRDLPIKYLETTTIYRDEKAGELNGLSRVRSVTQDDSHIFCTIDQVEQVLSELVGITQEFYKAIGMSLRARLSLRDDSEAYLGDKAVWAKAEDTLRKVIKAHKLDSYEEKGEAAFYGPKIDFMAQDAIGREWQLATPQLDFVQPDRFGLEYVDHDGSSKTPVMIHFALMGSIERFLSVYIEHTAGAFPLWLSPEQVRVLPISDKLNDFATELAAKLKQSGLRVVVDDSSESLGKKIRNAELMKTPYTLIVGEKEAANGTVSVRRYGEGDLGAQKIDDLITTLLGKVADRSID